MEREARRTEPTWHSVHAEARRAEAKFWVWLICGATVASSILDRSMLSCHRVFLREPARYAAVHWPCPRLPVTHNLIPPCTVPIPCVTAEKVLKMAHFLKAGSRNMAETCTINFSYPTSYSTSIPIGGLSALLLLFLMWTVPDLENFALKRQSAVFAFVPIFDHLLQKN